MNDSTMLKTLFEDRYSSTKLFLLLSMLLVILLTLTCKHWFLADDSFISFRYSRHLLDGLGLSFNEGERVEGYTNFLWVLIMAGGMKLGARPEWFSTVLSTLSGMILVVLVFRMGLQLYGRSIIILLAPACLCLSRTFVFWMTGGLEIRFFSLLVFAANVALLGELRITGEESSTERAGWCSGLLFGLAALTRPEGYLFMVFALGLVALRRSFKPFRQDIVRLSVFLLCAIPHLAWRYAYYDSLLPNTFYAKVAGVWWSQGTIYLWSFLSNYSLWLLIPLVLGNMGFLQRQEGRIQWKAKRFIGGSYFLAICIGHFVYLASVGGEHFENRLLDPILPFIYLCIQGGIIGAKEWVEMRSFTKFKRDVLLLSLILLSGLTIVLTAIPLVIGFRTYPGIAALESIIKFTERRIYEGKLMSEIIRPGEKIAARGAGALPYYNSDNYVLDMHGLNDREIARQPLTERGITDHERLASRSYVCSKRITFIDDLPFLFLHEPPSSAFIERFQRNGYFCVKVAPEAFLICGTTLTPEQVRERFTDYEIIFLPTASYCEVEPTWSYDPGAGASCRIETTR